MSLKYEPASEPLHISVEQLFLLCIDQGSGGGKVSGFDFPVFEVILGFRVKGSGCRVQGVGFRVKGSECRVQGVGFRVLGSGFWVRV